MRVGIIGAGRMATTHARELAQLGVEIAAVSDLIPERAEAFAAQYGATVCPSDRALVAADRLDAVYITTPTRAHADQVVLAAERGLAVFVEKPLALSVADAARAARAVERGGVIACVGYHWRYTEAVARAEALLQDAPIALLVCRWYWTLPPIPWLRAKDQGGGQIVDQVTHLIDLAQHFGGPIQTAYAAYTLNTYTPQEFHNWDGSAITYRFARGAVGAVEGTYALFPQIQERPALDIITRERLLRITPEGLAVHTPGGVEAFPNTRPFYRGLNEAFVQAVQTGNPALVKTPIRAGLRSLAATLAANHSATTGQVVDLDAYIHTETGGEA